jgi:hypothetical protein
MLLPPFGVMPSGQPFGGVGDGVDMVDGASATFTDVRVAGCARAGILFDNSSGSLASVTSTENRFGLVLQGSPGVTLHKATCDFTCKPRQGDRSGWQPPGAEPTGRFAAGPVGALIPAVPTGLAGRGAARVRSPSAGGAIRSIRG